MTNEPKSSSTFANQSKDSTTFTNQQKGNPPSQFDVGVFDVAVFDGGGDTWTNETKHT